MVVEVLGDDDDDLQRHGIRNVPVAGIRVS